MDRCPCLMYVLLLRLWSPLDISPIVGANGLIATLTQISPEGRPAEGGTVELRCSVSGLQTGSYVVEWFRVLPNGSIAIIAINGTSLDSKYSVSSDSTATSLDERLAVHNLTKQDTGFYICGAMMSGGIGYVGTQILHVTVNYLHPVCSPEGPFTVQVGTIQYMTCTSEPAEPQVQITVFANKNVYQFDFSKGIASYNLTVTESDDGNTLLCRINSTVLSQVTSCTIGPINVVLTESTSSYPDPTTRPTTAALTTGQSSPHPSTAVRTPVGTTETGPGPLHSTPRQALAPQDPTPWIAAFVVCLVLLAVSLVVIALLVHSRRYHKDRNQQKTDPFTELQPTDDKNRHYTETRAQDIPHQAAGGGTGGQEDGYEPTGQPDKAREAHSQEVEEDSGRDGNGYEKVEAYCETVDSDTAMPKDTGYAQVDGKGGTVYEVVRVPNASNKKSGAV